MFVKKEMHVPLSDLITCLSDIVDLVNPKLMDHHKKVAYIAYCLATQIGLGKKECNEILLAGQIHDIGALSCHERINTLTFELSNPHIHAKMGGELLSGFKPLAGIAQLVRYHHASWEGGNGKIVRGEEVPVGSHILHLADRVAVLVARRQDILKGTTVICRKIREHTDSLFMPELVDAFLELARKEYFWFDLASSSIDALLRRRVRLGSIDLNLDGLLSLSRVFATIIDFRSRFTANHSSGVAACAAAMARIAGFSERECQMMKVAGFLHDMGKLAVPTEILEKKGKLSPQERRIVMCHPFYTFRTLENINDLAQINSWAGFHHESLDGRGYPFRLHGRDLSLGSRIMAVADVFTALTEDRPYREGLSVENTLGLISGMAAKKSLDGRVVSMMERHVDEINTLRISAQRDSRKRYNTLNTSIGTLA
jgi:HD-GYP domain-containing protein (c-di-GMP phosphodiesterase class II)